MGLIDAVVMGSIVAGAVYLLYRSIWKKRGYCHGCDPEKGKQDGVLRDGR